MENETFFCFITDIKEHVVQVEFRGIENPYMRYDQSGVPRHLFNPEDVKLGQCFHVDMDGELITFKPFENEEWTKEDLAEVDKQVEKLVNGLRWE
jgi:ATP-dependent RNA circularization protein (DNA/RNA ligase family)